MFKTAAVRQTSRVLVHLMASPFFGGPERQVLGMANHLDRAYRTVFLSFAERGLAEPFLQKARDAGHEALALRHNAPHFKACAQEITAHLHELKAEILCCHGYKPDLIGLAAAKLARIPVISVSHGWTSATWKVRLNECADRLSLHGMNRIVCVSEGQARKVRACAIPRHKITVIHNAIDRTRFSPETAADPTELRSLFRGNVSQVVIALGRLSPEKGIGDLIRAATRVVSQRPDVGFVVFGDGPLSGVLKRQIVAANLQQRFILGGFRSDVDRLLPQADLVAIPSYTEGLPNVALEAHAASVPVVGTNVGGIPEVVIDQVTGRLVPAGHYQELGGNILDLLHDHDLRRMMGARGREHIETRFTFTMHCQKYERLFTEILGPA